MEVGFVVLGFANAGLGRDCYFGVRESSGCRQGLQLASCDHLPRKMPHTQVVVLWSLCVRGCVRVLRLCVCGCACGFCVCGCVLWLCVAVVCLW